MTQMTADGQLPPVRAWSESPANPREENTELERTLISADRRSSISEDQRRSVLRIVRPYFIRVHLRHPRFFVLLAS
jgi:hypothetical protein